LKNTSFKLLSLPDDVPFIEGERVEVTEGDSVGGGVGDCVGGLVVRFIYKSVSEDRCEGFALEYKTNLDADWTVQNEWYLHEDFVNGKWKVGMQVIPIENDDASMEFRFVNLDSNATMLFIDDVSVYGK